MLFHPAHEPDAAELESIARGIHRRVTAWLATPRLRRRRHRAAYRFVQDHANGLAIVVSRDGGVSFVVNREQEVVVWEQSVSP